MPTTITIDRIQLRRDLAATWASRNPTLLVGEQGVETDTRKFKIGDGITAWNALPYIGADAGTIAGTTLASNVVASSLTSVGTLSSLAVSGAASVAGTLAVSGSASFGPTWVGVVAGDFYQAYNATWNGTNWMRTDITRPAWLLQVNQANNMIFESYKAMNMWAAQPGANPIGPFTAIGGWLLVQSFSEFKDVTYGGFGIEVDGNGTVPYGRIRHATVGGAEVTDLLTNAYLDESGRDDTAQPSWSVGRVDDSFKVRRAPSGASLVWADLLAINSAGNLGLGVTPSASWSAGFKAFQIAGQGAGVSASTSASQVWLSSNGIYNGTNWIYGNSAAAGQYQIDTNAHKWFTAASGTAGNTITFTQAMTLDASGNLGVGTASPTAGFRLDLQDATARMRLQSTTGTNGTEQRFVNTGGTLYVGLDNSTGSGYGEAYAGLLWHGGNYPLIFATNNVRRMTLDTSGNLVLASGYMRVAGASAGAASTTTIGNTTATTVGATGAAAALPANPLGYIIAHVGTTQVKIPYYTA